MSRFLILGILLVWLQTAAASTIAIDQVLVIVNEDAITLSEYVARHKREALQGTQGFRDFDGEVSGVLLDQMITERLQLQRATLRGLTVSDQDIDRAMDFVARQNQISSDELLRQLDRDGITPTEFRNTLRDQRLIQRLVDVAVNSRVIVSESEVENYLQNHKELLATDESFEISHLFVQNSGKSDEEINSGRQRLAALRDTIISGVSTFEQAVEELSDASKDQGGYVGWRKINQLPEVFIDALRRTTVGGVSEMIISDNGFHLLKLHQKDGGGEVVLQNQVRHILIQPNKDRTPEEAREQAAEIRSMIVAGEDFEKLARLNSDDNQTRTEGGLLGWVSPGETAPAFENVINTLPIGELSEPVATRFGFHVIEVLGRRNADLVEAQANNDARRTIFNRKAAELYDEWNQSLRSEAYIEYVAVSVE